MKTTETFSCRIMIVKLLHSVGKTEEETLVINNLQKNVRESALAPITFKVFFPPGSRYRLTTATYHQSLSCSRVRARFHSVV